jgi:hypothetical protein
VLVLVFLAIGGGAMATVGGVMMLHYSETASFCGRCHTMGPELKAYAMSPHRDVPCAECHVTPGIKGFLKAKMNGTKQVIEIVTGNYPKPIPPPSHADLPSPKVTCMKCHPLEQITENGGPVEVVLRPRFKSDEANSREMLALILRPNGLGDTSALRGVHWHVDQEVTFTSTDEHSQKIDIVNVKEKDGTTKTFMSQAAVSLSSDVTPDVQRLTKVGTTRRMDCIDCHNRVGHGIPSPARAVDDAIASGAISTDLPYVKREAVALLDADYPSAHIANGEIAGIREMYAAKYPLVLKMRGKELDRAITELQRIYRDVASPEMKVTAKTYPNNLGHTTSAGCFRCHDGTHYQVVNRRLTTNVIPWACATCHTFPQVGSTVSGLSLGSKPDTHKDRLWVFNHKTATSSLDPGGTTCGACHSTTYCENCHKTGAAKVNHNEMRYSHPTAIARSGIQACAYCHQPTYCSRCHDDPVLKPSSTPAKLTAPTTAEAPP